MEVESNKISLTNEFDIQLIHATHPIFSKVQSLQFDAKGKKIYHNQQQIKSQYRKLVAEYSTAIRELVDDSDSEDCQLLTIEQLLSLAGVAFFQLEENANPGYHLASWANYRPIKLKTNF